MRWQRVAQAAIALFVIGFIAVLATTLRREGAQPQEQPPAPERQEKDAVTENPGGCEWITESEGARLFSLTCEKHFTFADGRQRFVAVEVSAPRDGREFIIRSREAIVTPKDGTVDRATFTGDVQMVSDGLEIIGEEASYVDAEGLLTIPGPVRFSRGRLSGSGVGATYDRTRDVLWILDAAEIHVQPDPKAGSGALDGSAKAIGLARADHFLRLTEGARLAGDGRVVTADELVIRLNEDNTLTRSMELRGNSRITGGAGGPQEMSARDIDLAYADDGRTLRHATLVENASVQLAAAGPAAGKRITGRTIDIGLGPDGSTVTALTARDGVVVMIPADGESPAKEIRAATLAAQSQGDGGLERARFEGGVEYVETRAARGTLAAIDRRVVSDSLLLETSPGLGSIQRADFRGNVTFNDAPDFRAVAPQGIYHVTGDRLELMPGDGLPGQSPLVTDGKISVAARTIDMTLSTRELSAETRVRSEMLPQKDGRKDRTLPSMLDEDQPVFVSANRLKYNGSTSQATYSGNAVMWQGDTTQLKGDTIVVDDRGGNLTVTGSVTTRYLVEEVDRATGERKRVPTTGSSETFTYVEKARLATYTGKARIVGAQGDVTGDKIELFMKADANELERAEAYGKVSVREGGRSATGSHLTYTAATDEYLMVGTPVEIIEERKEGGCVKAVGTTARFNRTVESASVDGTETMFMRQQSVPCPPRTPR